MKANGKTWYFQHATPVILTCAYGSLAVLRHLIWLELKNPYTLDLTVFLTKTGFPTKFAKVAQETEEARHSKPVSYALHWITKIARKNWICMG